MKKKTLEWLKQNALLLTTLLGVIFGLLLGISLRELTRVPEWGQQLISYPGEMFTRALQMMTLPLIISSLIVGSASLNAKMNGRIAMRTLGYFVSTSMLNAGLGIALALFIHPGSYVSKEDFHPAATTFHHRKNTLLDNFLDLGRNVVPSNIFAAAFQQTETVYQLLDSTSSGQQEQYVRAIRNRPGTNTLGIITFALIFGSVLGSVGEKGQPLIEAFKVMDHVIMKMIGAVMWLTPVGVASLITGKLLTLDDVGSMSSQLGLFVLTVLIGVLGYQLIVQQLIFLLIRRENPLRFYAGMMEATITGFSTASTAVALPITFRCIEKLGIDPRIAHFVLPIGATVNKDGTALFVAAASVFICQMNGIHLGFGQLFTTLLCSTCVSIASASVPSAALALMFIVLNSIGAPTEDIGLLFAVDWLVDRIRTTNNLLGDCYATAVVEHFSKKELKQMDLTKGTSSSKADDDDDDDDDAVKECILRGSRDPSEEHNTVQMAP